MGIDVENTMWVNVFSASLALQYQREGERVGSPGHALKKIDIFTEEAMAVADATLESYRRVCRKQSVERCR
jgi:hypothetical protein